MLDPESFLNTSFHNTKNNTIKNKEYFPVVMNKLIALSIAVILALTAVSTASAFTLYNPSTQTYRSVGAWSHQPYTFQARYTGAPGRPEGFGLVQNRAPYPQRGYVRYCDNKQLLGHTSTWTPGSFYSGLDSHRLAQPRYRSHSNRCPPTQRLQLNSYSWKY
jgi:hypothetical protein